MSLRDRLAAGRQPPKPLPLPEIPEAHIRRWNAAALLAFAAVPTGSEARALRIETAAALSLCLADGTPIYSSAPEDVDAMRLDLSGESVLSAGIEGLRVNGYLEAGDDTKS